MWLVYILQCSIFNSHAQASRHSSFGSSNNKRKQNIVVFSLPVSQPWYFSLFRIFAQRWCRHYKFNHILRRTTNKKYSIYLISLKNNLVFAQCSVSFCLCKNPISIQNFWYRLRWNSFLITTNDIHFVLLIRFANLINFCVH